MSRRGEIQSATHTTTMRRPSQARGARSRGKNTSRARPARRHDLHTGRVGNESADDSGGWIISAYYVKLRRRASRFPGPDAIKSPPSAAIPERAEHSESAFPSSKSCGRDGVMRMHDGVRGTWPHHLSSSLSLSRGGGFSRPSVGSFVSE